MLTCTILILKQYTTGTLQLLDKLPIRRFDINFYFLQIEGHAILLNWVLFWLVIIKWLQRPLQQTYIRCNIQNPIGCFFFKKRTTQLLHFIHNMLVNTIWNKIIETVTSKISRGPSKRMSHQINLSPYKSNLIVRMISKNISAQRDHQAKSTL